MARRHRSGFGVALYALLLLTTGCRRPEGQVPRYPGASPVKGDVMDLGPAIYYFARMSTPDTAKEVARFFDERLLRLPGWSKRAFGETEAVWDDGNMREVDRRYMPVDPSRFAGHVEILGTEHQTLVSIWQSAPK